jgi:hypothetical protein
MRSLNPAFTCPNEEMIVEAGASQLIEMFFIPQSAKMIEGDIEIDFSRKLKCYIAVSGFGELFYSPYTLCSLSIDRT